MIQKEIHTEKTNQDHQEKNLPLAKGKKQDFVLEKVGHSIVKNTGLKVILQKV